MAHRTPQASNRTRLHARAIYGKIKLRLATYARGAEQQHTCRSPPPLFMHRQRQKKARRTPSRRNALAHIRPATPPSRALSIRQNPSAINLLRQGAPSRAEWSRAASSSEQQRGAARSSEEQRGAARSSEEQRGAARSRAAHLRTRRDTLHNSPTSAPPPRTPATTKPVTLDPPAKNLPPKISRLIFPRRPSR